MSESNVPPPPPGPGDNDPYETAPPSAPPPPPDAGMLNPAPTPLPPPPPGGPGQPIGYANTMTGRYDGPPPDQNAKMMGMLCHLLSLAGLVLPYVGGWGGPLVIWLLKKQDHPFIDDQGKESLNFQLTVLIASIVVSPTICLFGLGIVLLILIAIAAVILAIMAGVRANNGEAYRYPMTLRLIK